MFEIKKAEREGAPITAAFMGGSGSGKTYSALKFARGLVGPTGKIVVIDTEGGRSKIYANDKLVAPFHHLDLISPYTSERFRQAFKDAIAYGADAIIIDTISHEHEGFLEFADQEENRLSSRRDKSRAKWIKPKATRKRFYSAISSSHPHVIVTIRLNRIVDMNKQPAVEIMKPECDKDLPYRMDLAVELNKETHLAKYIKVPEPLKHLIEDGVLIEVEHGALLAKDVASHKAPDNTTIMKVIHNLEEVCESSPETLRMAYQAAWHNTNDAGHKELQKHLPRLKQIAQTAIEVAENADDDDGFPGDFPSENNGSNQ